MKTIQPPEHPAPDYFVLPKHMDDHAPDPVPQYTCGVCRRSLEVTAAFEVGSVSGENFRHLTSEADRRAIAAAEKATRSASLMEHAKPYSGSIKQCQSAVFSGARWDMGGHRCGKAAKFVVERVRANKAVDTIAVCHVHAKDPDSRRYQGQFGHGQANERVEGDYR
jgi:hypothetical protein